jgi:hypothetical protein
MLYCTVQNRKGCAGVATTTSVKHTVKRAYLPAAQLAHVAAAEAPGALENLPAPQSTHTLLPRVAAYWPGPHVIQADTFVLPSVVRYLPGAQSKQ